MKKRNRILLAGLVVIAAGGIAWLTFRTREPGYAGKSLTAWLEDFSCRIDGNWVPVEGVTRNRAVLAIREMGTNAVPYLVKMLNRKDSKQIVQLQWGISTLAYRAGLNWRLQIYRRRDYNWHTMALEGLDALGDDAKPCLPALTDYVEHDPNAYSVASWTRRKSLMLLYKLNPESDFLLPSGHAEILAEILNSDREAKNRRSAAETLGRMGEEAKEHAEWIQPALMDKAIEVRIAATNALKRIDPEAAAKAGVK